MNTVQETIAKMVGFDQMFDSQEAQLQEMAGIMEHLVSDNQMLQREIEDIDYLNLLDTGNIIEVLPIKDRRKTIARLRRLRHDNPLAKQAVKLVVRFTLGKGVQWVLAQEPEASSQPSSNSFPDEEPPELEPGKRPPPLPTKLIQLPRAARSRREEIVQDSDPIRDIINSFWNDSDNKLAFTTHRSMQQTLDEIVTDGEKFYACFPDSSPPYVKVSEIPLEEINHIIYDPDNRLRPLFYKRGYQPLKFDGANDQFVPDGAPVVKYYWDYRIKETDQAELLKKIRIPKGKIEQKARVRHVMINELWTTTGKRGISELYSSREWFRVFREFMEGRAAINAAAQAVSYLRKIKGSPSTVAKFTGKLGNLPVGENVGGDGDLRKLTRPVAGAIYDSNEAVDLEWMKTDTGAVNAKEDARLLLMSAGAGVGTMIHYFGEGGDANLATAQSMELPMVKSYEDWQQFIDDFYMGWFEYVLRTANGDSEEEDQLQTDLARIGFSFPPIISQDVVKYTTSWSQIVRDIAPNNMAVKKQAMKAVLAIMGVPNIDGIMPEIEAEMKSAEVMRQQQQQNELEVARQQATMAASGQLPNDGLDPNTKRLVSGKGEKISNGPKSA